ncbi:MAG: hypothetical protein AB1716_10845 [Planctomycetota bacterium]
MSRTLRLLALAAVTAWPLAASAQYSSELVGFNGPPIGDPATCREMFQIPQISGTTSSYVVANTSGYNHNAAYRETGLQTEGAACLEAFWDWAQPTNDYSWVRLTTGSAPVRPNPGLHTQGKVRFKITNKSELFAGTIGLCIGIRETGQAVPQMWDGGGTGEIEWVGVKTTPNAIMAGPDHIVDTTATGDDEQFYPVGTNIAALNLHPDTAVIGPGPNGVIDSTPANDDLYRIGYMYDPADPNDPNDDIRRPDPVITLAPFPSAYTVEWDLRTGAVTLDGVPQGGGFAAFTGDGVLTAPRGTFEHVALTRFPGDTAVRIDVGIDELQFEAPEPDPTVPPRVVSPIIANDTQVTVTRIMYPADQVTLYERTLGLVGTEVPVGGQDVVFTIPPAQAGQEYTARQRNGQNGVVSDPSPPVVVLPGPPPYTFSVLLDGQGSGSCTLLGWEWLYATEWKIWYDPGQAQRWTPLGGLALFPDDAQWQAVDVPLDNPSIIVAGPGGNGSLEPSPTGNYTMDSIWFTLGQNADPNDLDHEVFVDAVQFLDPNGLPTTILNMEDGVNRLQYPRGQSPVQVVTSAHSTLSSYDGSTSHRLAWSYASNDPNLSLGQLQRVAYNCGTSALIPDNSKTIRFHMLLRGKRQAPSIALPGVIGPIIVGTQTAVRVTNAATATSVELFINGASAGTRTPSGTYTDFTGLTLVPGDSISAKQTLPEGTSDFAYPRAVSATPPPPNVGSPLLPGATTVRVNNCLIAPYATASLVSVYVNGQPAGSAAGGAATVNVTVAPALQVNDSVTATQTVNGATSVQSAPVVVSVPAPLIYKVPAAGEARVRLQGLFAGATHAIVNLKDPGGQLLQVFTAVVNPGATVVDVPVSGLQATYLVTGQQRVTNIDSLESPAETVTAATPTTIINDGFEYDDPTYLTNWPTSAEPRPPLVTDYNSTVPGTKSVYVQPGTPGTGGTGAGRVHQTIANLTPTDAEPVVWNVNMYDAYGPGASNVQFAQLNGMDTDFWYQHVGMLSWAPQNTNYYQYRAVGNGGPNWVDLNQLDAPIRSVGWHNFTIVHKSRTIDVYVDGKLCIKNLALSAETIYDRARIGPGYASANAAWYDDFSVEVGPVRFALVPPVVVGPLLEDETTVRVADILMNTTSVRVFADNVQIAQVPLTPPNLLTTLDVTVPALVAGQVITARQTTTVESVMSAGLEVGRGNGDLLVCLGVRETNDTGPLGTPGDPNGTIEWIGATAVLSGAPQGKPLPVTAGWQTVTFDPNSDPILAFPNSGNGVIETPRGVLEHLALAVKADAPARSAGVYALYIDNVVNVGAGTGGADFVIADFEAFAPGTEVLFNKPRYSGSTVHHMIWSPDISEVTDQYASGGQHSAFVSWFYYDSTQQRWTRLSTFGAANLWRPIIDLTKPIRMDLHLAPAGPPVCRGDCNCDGRVDFGDINPFVQALSDLPGWQQQYPNCPLGNPDVNGDGRIDFGDINPFVALLSAGGGPCQ